MRLIYFDAAGLSNPEHEPFIVVAGIILHGDSLWKPVSEYLSALADTYAPPEHRNGFAFHATELFSGSKRFPRDKYPREQRWKILDELIGTIPMFDLPIVWGHVRRAEVAAIKTGHDVTPVIHGQILAFTVAAAAAERWMKLMAPKEVASMSMEDDPQSRKFMKVTQRYLSDPRSYRLFDPDFEPFKLSTIIYPIHFEEKTDSSALQLADVCAFTIKRKLMQKPDADRFYNPLEPFFVHKLKSLPDAPGQKKGV